MDSNTRIQQHLLEKSYGGDAKGLNAFLCHDLKTGFFNSTVYNDDFHKHGLIYPYYESDPGFIKIKFIRRDNSKVISIIFIRPTVEAPFEWSLMYCLGSTNPSENTIRLKTEVVNHAALMKQIESGSLFKKMFELAK